MNDYRVDLDIYNGPLDLLLYLIRQDEVDVHDIPVARITEQYLRYVDMLKAIDPNLVGEFMVMAATLMEIKTRMLLPTPPLAEGEDGGVQVDPRAELVRQLLEYKAFKDVAGDLRDAADERSLKFARKPIQPDSGEGIDIEDVQLWDLLDAFGKLMVAVGQNKPIHEVIYDDTPLELYAIDILDRLDRDGPLTFLQIFEGRTNRGEIIGLFLALLELTRQKKILATQNRPFSDIQITLNPNTPAEDKPPVDSLDSSPDPAHRPEGQLKSGGATDQDERQGGRYVATGTPGSKDSTQRDRDEESH